MLGEYPGLLSSIHNDMSPVTHNVVTLLVTCHSPLGCTDRVFVTNSCKFNFINWGLIRPHFFINPNSG
jgi:hypothetical protein